MGFRCKVEKAELIWENSAWLLYFPKSADMGKVVFTFINGEMRRLRSAHNTPNAFILLRDWNLSKYLEGETLELVEEDDPVAK